MVVVARITAKDDKQDEVLSVLKDLVSRARDESGTVAYALHRHQSDPSVFLVYEQYKDVDALVEHSSTDYFKKAFKHLDRRLFSHERAERLERLLEIVG